MCHVTFEDLLSTSPGWANTPGVSRAATAGSGGCRGGSCCTTAVSQRRRPPPAAPDRRTPAAAQGSFCRCRRSPPPLSPPRTTPPTAHRRRRWCRGAGDSRRARVAVVTIVAVVAAAGASALALVAVPAFACGPGPPAGFGPGPARVRVHRCLAIGNQSLLFQAQWGVAALRRWRWRRSVHRRTAPVFAAGAGPLAWAPQPGREPVLIPGPGRPSLPHARRKPASGLASQGCTEGEGRVGGIRVGLEGRLGHLGYASESGQRRLREEPLIASGTPHCDAPAAPAAGGAADSNTYSYT